MSKYEMTQRKGNPHFKVTIVADMNDGDYLTTISKYSDEKFHKDVIDELMKLKTHHAYSGQLEGAEFNYVSIPWDSQGGMDCHSLVSLNVEYIDAYGTVYDVEIFELEEEEV